MDRAEREVSAARHLFVEMLLRNLMVAECMRADDPIREARDRSADALAAADGVLARRADNLSHLVLEHVESFWNEVRAEVETRRPRNGKPDRE